MYKHSKVLQYFFLFAFIFLAYNINAQTNDIEIPNVFTPNGDKVNDLFKVDGLTSNWDLSIYDRWGTLVFATDRAEVTGWDGHNILGMEVVTGVYFYILKQNGTEESYNGTVSLFR
jgi:gliding motility-associated-like protein